MKRDMEINEREVLPANGVAIFNKDKLNRVLDDIDALNNLNSLKKRISDLARLITCYRDDREDILTPDSNGETVSWRRDVLLSELNQILEAQTLERAKYYLARLQAGVQEIKTSRINDINLLRW
ncbi:MAG: DNA methyltransferase, partial [bacterium]|nr:DNA methyltransferase [bacterium]